MLGRCRVLFRVISLHASHRHSAEHLFFICTLSHSSSRFSFIRPSTTWSTVTINPKVNEWYGLFDRCFPGQRRVDDDGFHLGSSFFFCSFFPFFLVFLWRIGRSLAYRSDTAVTHEHLESHIVIPYSRRVPLVRSFIWIPQTLNIISE